MNKASRPVHARTRHWLSRDMLHVLGWTGARYLSAAIVLAWATRALGVQGFATFAAASALGGIIGSCLGGGMGLVLLRTGVDDASMIRPMLNRATTTCLLAAAGLCILAGVVLLASGGDSASWSLVATATVELLVVSRSQLAAYACQAAGHTGRGAILSTIPALTRSLVPAMPLVFGSLSAGHAFLLGYNILGVIGLLVVTQRLGALLPPTTPAIRAAFPWRDTLPFATHWALAVATSDGAKVLMPRIAGLEIAGLFSAGSRLQPLAMAFVSALNTAELPGLFKIRDDSIGRARLARRLLLASLIWGMAGGGLLCLLAPLSSVVFGEEFSAASTILLAFGISTPIAACRQAAGTILTALAPARVRIANDTIALAVQIGALFALGAWGNGLGAVIAFGLGELAGLVLFALAINAANANTPDSDSTRT